MTPIVSYPASMKSKILITVRDFCDEQIVGEAAVSKETETRFHWYDAPVNHKPCSMTVFT